jgi:dTMP kinase
VSGPPVPAAGTARRGRFVTFEGGEGAGKSTQIARLAERLEAEGIRVVRTREPGGTPGAEAVRRILLSGGARRFGPGSEALLFAAARADHVATLIAPALGRGTWVLCDRFTDSTRVYQGTAGVGRELLAALEKVALGELAPDLTLVLDVPPKVGLARVAARSAEAPDRFEGDPLEEHEARRRAFLAIARAEPARCVVVDAAGEAEAVAAAVWQAVRERLGLTVGESADAPGR